jgi:hypothetical protein
METHYVLDDRGEPQEERDIVVWESWFATADRGIARTNVTPEITVLTTFHGVVELPEPGGELKLFGSRVFGGVLDAEEVGHRTRAESLAAHAALSEWCRIGNAPGAGIPEELDEISAG